MNEKVPLLSLEDSKLPSAVLDAEIVAVVCAVAPGASTASKGRHSSADSRPRRRRCATGRTPATARAEERSRLSVGEAGQRGADCRPAEEEGSGGETSGRQLADAGGATRRPGDPATRRPGDPATRRPGDPATRRPGDPATRRPGDHYTVGTLSGACQPPGRKHFGRPAVHAQRIQNRRSRRAQRVPRRVHDGHRVASEPVARHDRPAPRPTPHTIPPSMIACTQSHIACPTCANRKPNPAANQDDERRATHTLTTIAGRRSAGAGSDAPGRGGASRHASTSSGPSPGTTSGSAPLSKGLAAYP